MSIQTNIQFRNENDPEFIKATTGSFADLQEWEDENGMVHERPGAKLEGGDSAIVETDDEYGGFVITLADIPKGTTHIVIFRS